MSETQSPDERQQEREANILDRRNESNDSIDGITKPLEIIDGNLIESIEDVDTREAVKSMAKGYAHLAELVTGRDPPEQEPYGWWHRDIQISDPTLVNKTDTIIEASSTLEVHKWFNEDAVVEMRVSERNNIDGKVKTVDVKAVEGDVVSLEVIGLDPDKEYNVRFSAECEDLSDYSSSIVVETEQ